MTQSIVATGIIFISTIAIIAIGIFIVLSTITIVTIAIYVVIAISPS